MKKIGILSCEGSIKNSYTLSDEELITQIGQNSGNLVFQYAAWNIIEDEKIKIRYDMTQQQIEDDCSCVVVPSSCFIREDMDLGGFVNFLKKIKVPIIFLGLGVQSDSYDVLGFNFHDSILELIEILKNNFVGVRGEYTQKVLESFGVENSIIIGCPSNFIAPEENINKVKKNWDLEISHTFCNSCIFWSKNQMVNNAEQKIFDMMLEKSGPYVVQSIAPMINLFRSNNPELVENFKSIKNALCKEISNIEFLNILNNRFRFYIDANQWLEDCGRSTFSYGLRFHGNMVSFQAGVPTVWIYHDARTQELCETMGLPRISLKDFVSDEIQSLEDLKQRCEINWDEHDQKRSVLRNNLKFILNTHGVKSKL